MSNYTRIELLISSIQERYYYNADDGKVYSKTATGMRALTASDGYVRLMKKDGSRARVPLSLLETVEAQLPSSPLGAFRVRVDQIKELDNPIKYFGLLAKSNKVITDENGTWAAVPMDKSAYLADMEFFNSFDIKYCDIIQSALMYHYIESKPYVEIDNLMFGDLVKNGSMTLKVGLLFLLWSKGGYSRIDYNMKQIALTLDLNYSLASVRAELSESIDFLRKSYLADVRERSIKASGYSYIQTNARLIVSKQLPKVISEFSSALKLAAKIDKKDFSNEEFRAIIMEMIENSLLD